MPFPAFPFSRDRKRSRGSRASQQRSERRRAQQAGTRALAPRPHLHRPARESCRRQRRSQLAQADTRRLPPSCSIAPPIHPTVLHSSALIAHPCRKSHGKHLSRIRTNREPSVPSPGLPRQRTQRTQRRAGCHHTKIRRWGHKDRRLRSKPRTSQSWTAVHVVGNFVKKQPLLQSQEATCAPTSDPTSTHIASATLPQLQTRHASLPLESHATPDATERTSAHLACNKPRQLHNRSQAVSRPCRHSVRTISAEPVVTELRCSNHKPAELS